MAGNNGPKIVTDGLTTYLDAADKKSYSGSGSTWRDLTTNANKDWSLFGNTAYSSADGGSFSFDGNGDTFRNQITKFTTCTISSWAKVTSLTNNPMLVCCGFSGAGPALYFVPSFNQAYWFTWDGTSNPFGSIPASMTDGRWHNYVVTNDAASNTKLYYDGVLLGTATYKSTTRDGSNYFYVGEPNTNSWSGNVATLMIHNRILSQSEITQNYNALRGRFKV